MHTSTNWTNNKNKKYDYAVLELDKNIGDSTGYFGSHYTSASLKKKAITVTGYPIDYYRQMWTMSGVVKKSSKYKVYYSIDTSSGQSGCPVYWKSSDYGYQGIAIHTYGGSTNFGTRITSYMYDFFASFRN